MSLENDTEFLKGRQASQHLDCHLWDPDQRTQLSPAQMTDYRSCEIISIKIVSIRYAAIINQYKRWASRTEYELTKWEERKITLSRIQQHRGMEAENVGNTPTLPNIII
jgi:hypothetical protein